MIHDDGRDDVLVDWGFVGEEAIVVENGQRRLRANEDQAMSAQSCLTQGFPASSCA